MLYKDTDEQFYMRFAMRKMGGSFIVALANCLEKADGINYAKLEKAFPEYFKSYIELGKDYQKEDKKL